MTATIYAFPTQTPNSVQRLMNAVRRLESVSMDQEDTVKDYRHQLSMLQTHLKDLERSTQAYAASLQSLGRGISHLHHQQKTLVDILKR